MKVEWKRGWKVIRREDRKSCTAFHRKHPVEYLKGKEIRPWKKNGPLAVFETRKAAREFMHTNAGRVDGLYNWLSWKVVRCRYLPSDENVLWEMGVYHYKGKKRIKQHVPRRTAFAKVVICSE